MRWVNFEGAVTDLDDYSYTRLKEGLEHTACTQDMGSVREQ